MSAGVAQLVEQLTCNQPVGGSTPLASSIFPLLSSIYDKSRIDKQMLDGQNARSLMVGFPSGQRDQTVNLTRKLRWFESTPHHHYFRAAVIS